MAGLQGSAAQSRPGLDCHGQLTHQMAGLTLAEQEWLPQHVPTGPLFYFKFAGSVAMDPRSRASLANQVDLQIPDRTGAALHGTARRYGLKTPKLEASR
jgi:hypothetical protein